MARVGWRRMRRMAARGRVWVASLLIVALIAVAGYGAVASAFAGGASGESAARRAAISHSAAPALERATVAHGRTLAAQDTAACPSGGQPLSPAVKTPRISAPATSAPPATSTHSTDARQSSQPPTIAATEGYLFDPTTGQVLFSKNADHEMAMASTTKIMTAMTALTFGSLSQRITIGPDTVAMQNGIDSVAGLQLGDSLTLCELLYALLLPSGDDAAVAIAEGVAGTEARFVAEMNAEAALLGLWRTHYANPDGLDENGHYTTARDLAQLAAYAMQIPVFAQVVGTATYTLPQTANHIAYTWNTTNYLLTATNYYQGATGVKTGTTGNAGACLVFSAARNGRQLIGVVLNDPTDAGRFTDATALLDWGFAQGG